MAAPIPGDAGEQGLGDHSSLKKERIKKQIYKNRELAIVEVADYSVTPDFRAAALSHGGRAGKIRPVPSTESSCKYGRRPGSVSE